MSESTLVRPEPGLSRFVYSRRFAVVVAAFMLAGGFALSAAEDASARPAVQAAAAR